MVKMRAVVYKGPFEVEVSEVEKPSILHPSDVIVKSLFLSEVPYLLT